MTDLVDQIIDYEQGDLDDEGIIALFAELIRSGDAWRLQGMYGRAAMQLIEQGYIDRKGNILWPTEDRHCGLNFGGSL